MRSGKIDTMSNPLSSALLSEDIKNILGLETTLISWLKLPGDASNREFYRLNLSNNTNSNHPSSLVLMKVCEPEAADIFLNVQNYLYRCQIPVPKLYGYNPKNGLLFLEDLGDKILESEVKCATSSVSIKYYQQAIDCLLDMQLKTALNKDSRCIAFTLAFDVDRFMFEFDFFIQNVILKHKGKKIRPKDEAELKKQFLFIATRLSQEPRYFAHRDYHSRNLLISQGKIRMVDFQDARMGLCQYDLASLLRDSYVVLDSNLRDDLIDYYLDAKKKLEGKPVDSSSFRKIFDYTCLQRNFKAASSFAYLTYEKNKPNFLQYLPDTFTYVKENLLKYPELTTLHQVLSEYVEELR